MRTDSQQDKRGRDFRIWGTEKILKAFCRKKTGQLQTNKSQKWRRASGRARFDQWRRANSGIHFLNRLKLRCFFRCCVVQLFSFLSFLFFFFLVGYLPITLITTYYISCLYAILVSMPRYTHIYKMYIHVYIHTYLHVYIHAQISLCRHTHTQAIGCILEPWKVVRSLSLTAVNSDSQVGRHNHLSGPS